MFQRALMTREEHASRRIIQSQEATGASTCSFLIEIRFLRANL